MGRNNRNKRNGNVITRKNNRGSRNNRKQIRTSKRHGLTQLHFDDLKGDNMSVADIEKMTEPIGTDKGTAVHQGGTVATAGTAAIKIVRPAPAYWSAPEPKELQGHKLAPENHPVVFTPMVKAKIDTLMAIYPNIEWFVYLSGKREGNTTFVEDLIVPTQTVTSVRVDKIELENMGSLPIVGVMHSHHGMGNGFSGTDDAYINANHLLSLCISHGGINGQFRWNTPEGDCVVLNAPVSIKYDFDFKVEEFVEHCKKEITEIRYVHVGHGIFTQQFGFNGLEDDLNDPLDELFVVPDFCPKCASEDIAEIPASGWFCVKCGHDYYLEDDAFNDRIGFNETPPDELNELDGTTAEGWDVTDEAQKLIDDAPDYPLAPYKWREAEDLGYYQCDECGHHYKPIDSFKGVHPTTKEVTILCKECYCDSKYKKQNEVKDSKNCWNTKPPVDTRLIQCVNCKEHHDYIDNYKTPVGDLCEDCYTKWSKSKEIVH